MGGVSAKIALGFGNNIDYEILWQAERLQELMRRYQVREHELTASGAISGERDLLISILGFMRRGAGGERFVASSALIEDFAARFEKKITLGGSPVRAAIAMGKLGYRAALHLVTQSDQVRRLLPVGSPYVCSNPNDSAYPHLIVQFDKGARLRAGDIDIRARQSNRLIYHCNADNIAMRLNEDFADFLAEAQVLLISGFNAMQSKTLLMERLATVSRMLERLPRGALVFYEDGGYFDPSLRQLLYRRLGRRLDICSMNEDELQAQLKHTVDLRDVAQLRAALARLSQHLPARIIVLHTRHWALAYGAGARDYAAALKAGLTLATSRFRYGDDFTLAQYRDIENRAPLAENARFAAALNRAASDLYCVPVAAVEQSDATTIGLGDAFVGGFLPALIV